VYEAQTVALDAAFAPSTVLLEFTAALGDYYAGSLDIPAGLTPTFSTDAGAMSVAQDGRRVLAPESLTDSQSLHT